MLILIVEPFEKNIFNIFPISVKYIINISSAKFRFKWCCYFNFYFKHIYVSWNSVCKNDYIKETESKVILLWVEHNNPTCISEPAAHLKKYLIHSFNLFLIANACNNKRTRKNSEAIYIVLKRPKLNDQIKYNEVVLLRNSIM